MARIGNVVLPAELNELLVQLLQRVPDEVMVKVGRNLLSGGFHNAQPTRERLAVTIRGSSALPDWLENILRTFMPGTPVFETLSPEGAATMAEHFAALVGPGQTALPMLFDKRAEVHKL